MMNNNSSIHISMKGAPNPAVDFALNISSAPKAKTFSSSYYDGSLAHNAFEQASITHDHLKLSKKYLNLSSEAIKESTTKPETKTKESLITEIIIPLSSGNQNDVVLPMLAHLSQQVENRWFTWITCSKLTTQELCKYNFAQEKVRIIRAKNEEEAHWLMWDALNNGTSATVVSDTGAISLEVRNHLNQAAKHGYSRAILLSELT